MQNLMNNIEHSISVNRLQIDLPTDFLRSNVMIKKTERVSKRLTVDAIGKAKAFTSCRSLSEKSFYLATYYVWISKYTDNKDVLYAVFQLGADANIVPETITFQSLVSTVNDNVVKVNLLSNVEFTFGNEMSDDNDTHDNDLTFHLEDNHDGYTLHLYYDNTLFEEETSKKMRDSYLHLINTILDIPNIRINDICLLNEHEQNTILVEWNRTEKEYSKTKSVCHFFEEQVEMQPDHIAVTCGRNQISYSELNRRVNDIAFALKQRGASSGHNIGILLHRSVDMMASILAVLKIGASYIPVDPEFPNDRVCYVLENSNAYLLLTSHAIHRNLGFDQQMLYVDTDVNNIKRQIVFTEKIGKDSISNIIYTSGSTGKPKGVMVRHESLINLNTALVDTLKMNQYHRILCITTISFDIFITESLIGLMNGLEIVLATELEQKDIFALNKLLKTYPVDIMQTTPSRMKSILEYADNLDGFKKTKVVLLAGEALPLTLVKALERTLDAEIFNLYGPTETTVYSTIHKIERDPRLVLIGKPVANTKVYILDSDGQPVPVGAPGEMYISGAGMAKGYYNNKVQTRERFIDNPFERGHKMYRTGDLVRWHKDGSIEYIDRIDNQVKIRGYRVELEEVEEMILRCGMIRSTVVAAKTDSYDNKVLVAYLIAADHMTLDINAIRKYLIAKLPEYMVPSHFIQLSVLPFTPNGKIDKKSLPNPTESNVCRQNNYIPPTTVTEQLLTEIWCEVFGQGKIGIIDNFVEIGGYSLLATKIIAKIRIELKVELNIQDLFKNPTIRQLALILEVRMTECGTSELEEIKVLDRNRKSYRLSPSQERMWFSNELSDNKALFNTFNIMHFSGKLQVELLEQTLAKIIERHDAFRMNIREINGELSAYLAEKIDFSLKIVNFSDYDSDIESKIHAIMQEDTTVMFDLEHDLPYQFKLYILPSNEYYLSVVVHHIIFDGSSMEVLCNDILEIYHALYEKGEAHLPDLTVNYVDYMHWRRNESYKADRSASVDYWKETLGDVEEPLLDLPTDRKRLPVLSYRGRTYCHRIESAELDKLRQFNVEQGSTMFATLLSIYQVLLHRYSNRNDIIVGVPMSERDRKEADQLIGFFINTVAIRTRIEEDTTFRQVLGQVKESVLMANIHQHVSVDSILEELQIERNLSYTPLYQVLFAMQTDLSGVKSLEPNITVDVYELGNKNSSQYDLTFSMNERSDHIDLLVEYSTDLFDESTILYMVEMYKVLLNRLVDDSDQAIGEVPMVSLDPSGQSGLDNVQAAPFKPVHTLFEEQVLTHSNQRALVFGDEQITYQELNNRANILAKKLMERSPVKNEKVIAILLERSIDFIVSILAIWKCGAAYLPIDPAYPKERIDFLLNDSGACILCTRAAFAEYMKDKVHCIVLEEEQFGHIEENIQVPAQPNAMAYIIYTSGTTGKPKGVIVEHGNIANTIRWRQSEYQMGEKDVILHLLSFSFDASISTLWTPLVSGSSVIIADETKTKDPELIVELIKSYHVTHFSCTPVLYKYILQNGSNDVLASLSKVTLGGESITEDLITSTAEKYPYIEIINEYGPTEASIVTTFRRNVSLTQKNLGYPISNMNLYVLNRSGQLQPDGVVGELYIGGTGVARGYINRRDLTEQQFINHPFLKERLYRTGDLVKKLRDGSFEFLGRIDTQVKFHGYRIELGEIESVIRTFKFVKEAVVCLKEEDTGNVFLTAYLAVSAEFDREMLNGYLKQKLPHYLIPTGFVIIDKIPLTVNGKIDYKNLPDYRSDEIDREEFAEADTEMEKRLVSIWSSILGIKKIGKYDNFFSIGGDSILSIQIVSRARAEGIILSPKMIFENKTVAELAKVATTELKVIAEQGTVTGEVLLSPIQHWFFEQDLKNRNHFNQSVLLETPADLDLKKLSQVIQIIVSHHDMLRARYIKDGNNYKQIIEKESSYPIDFIDLSGMSDEEKRQKIEYHGGLSQAKIDIFIGKIMDVSYFSYGNHQPGRLLIVIHHLVIDGVSWRILLDNLMSGYQSLVSGKPLNLGEKTCSYLHWMEEQKKYADSGTLQEELKYWCSPQRSGRDKIAVDNPEGLNTEGSAVKQILYLDEAMTDRLFEEAKKYHVQIQELLLAVFMDETKSLVREEIVLVDLEGHGREVITDVVDVSNTLGWFTTMYPVPIKVGNNTGEGMICSVKDAIHNIPNKGIGYGILKYLSSSDTKEMFQKQSAAEIGFNYMGIYQKDVLLDAGFRWAVESKGVQICPAVGGACIDSGFQRIHKLEVESAVSNGQLYFEIAYSKNNYNDDTIARILERCVQLLEHYAQNGLTVKSLIPSDFPLANINFEELEGLLEKYPDLEDLYTVSPLQEGMLFQNELERHGGNYNVQFQVNLSGDLDQKLFIQSWDDAICQFEVLRTVYNWNDVEQAHQIVLASNRCEFSHQDWSGLSSEKQMERLDAFQKEDRFKGFDFSRVPIRFNLIYLGNSGYCFILSVFHTVLDGWSWPLIWNKVIENYEALNDGKEIQHENRIPYSRYIEWIQKQDLGAAKEFWSDYFSEIDGPTPLPACDGYSVDLNEAKTYGSSHINLSEGETKCLFNWTKENQITMNTVIMGAWSLLLGFYTRESSITLGTIVSGRSSELPGVEKMVGMFINTIPMAIKISHEISFVQWMRQIQENQLQTRQYEYSPLNKVQKWSGFEPGTELFHSLFVYENYPVTEQLDHAHVIIDKTEILEQVNYPLTLIGIPDKELTLKFMYEEGVFLPETIYSLLSQLKMILLQFYRLGQEKISEVQISTAEDLEQVKIWNEHSQKEAYKGTVHRLFEESASQYGEQTAVQMGDDTISYRKLNERSNRIAHYLIGKGVKVGSLVVICMERSIDLITGLIGILKAGGIYVPVDPEYPRDRIDFMLEDTQTQYIITDQANCEKVERNNVVVINLDAEQGLIEMESKLNPDIEVSAVETAYVIYTSGSTGTPKGVCIPHRAVMRIIHNTNYIHVTPTDIFYQGSTVSFDASVFEIWGCLCNGAKMLMVPKHVIMDIEELARVIRDERVSIIFLTTALFNVMIDNQISAFEYTRQVLFGGDRASVRHVKKALDYLGKNRLINLYGPSETAVCATYYKVNEVHDMDKTIPIGYPVTNTNIYVTGDGGQLLPPGVPGELCIGGIGLANGYLYRTQLTEEKFVESRFNDGERLYRSGDIVKQLPDGAIDFIGRVDNQVKIRGFRIELSEIETVLLRLDQVKDVKVVAREEGAGDKKIVAYVVCHLECDVEQIREYLSDRLPEYMVPAIIMVIDNLPVNKNGKVDVKALPVPVIQQRDVQQSLVELTDTEQKLIRIWEETLGVQGIQVNDNFFHLGGDSILSILVVSRAKKAGLYLTPKQLFRYPTISQLGNIIQTTHGLAAEQKAATGEVLLTPIQTWFFEQNLNDPSHFNQAMVLETSKDVDQDKLREALFTLSMHHDALRVTFESDGEHYRQVDTDKISMQMEVLDLSAETEASFEKEWKRQVKNAQSGLDIYTGKLLNVLYVKSPRKEKNYLLMIIHHLVVDGVSWRLLVEDLNRVYQQLQTGERPLLSDKTTSFKQWSELLYEYRQSEEVVKEKTYWQTIQNRQVDKICTDFTDGTNFERESSSVSMKLDEEESQLLLKKLPSEFNVHINDLLLAALQLAFKRTMGISVLKVDLEGHGREEFRSDIDLSHTVGWFTTMYPIILDMGDTGNDDMQVLKSVKEQLERVPNKGIGYGLLRYIHPCLGQEADVTADAEISFNYLGQFDQVVNDNSYFKWSDQSAEDEISSENHRAHLIDVGGMVIKGRLNISWIYSTKLHHKKTILKLAEAYISILRQFIKSVSDQSKKLLMRYPLAKLNYNQLNTIVEKYQDIETIYTLSPLQQGILYQSQVNRNNGDYIIQFKLPIEGGLDVAHWREAWQDTSRQFAILRTVFEWEKLEQGHQIVLTQTRGEFQYFDLVQYTDRVQERMIEEYLEQDRTNGFDFKSPPVRYTLIKTGIKNYLFVWCIHHILVDGWSWPIIWKHAFQKYSASQKGISFQPQGERPYKDYIQWLQRQDPQRAKKFWSEYLKDFKKSTPLPMENAVGDGAKEAYDEVMISIDEDQSERFRKWSNENNITINTLLQGVWALLLSRYSGEDDVMFGTIMSGRPADLEGVEEMAGLFINTLPTRIRLIEQDSIEIWMREIQNMQLEMRQYEYSTLTEIQGWSDFPHGKALFNSLYVYESYPMIDQNSIDMGVKLGEVEGQEQTNYPLVFMGIPGKNLRLRIVYDIYHFEKESIDTLLHQLTALLEGICQPG